jgi:hypothetical protein
LRILRAAIDVSIGGIVALGLFKMNWTVAEAMKQFKSLVSTAFSNRELLAVPGFKNVAQIFCSYRYKTDGIEGALKRAFGLHPLYGQIATADSEPVKVGVVAASDVDKRPYLFANYSRNPSESKRIHAAYTTAV